MRKEVITYEDYDGNTRTEEFYFNLTQAEVAEMNLSVEGGYQQMMRRIISAQDGGSIISAFKDFIRKAYGEKSPDGRRLMKSPELATAFMETPAYDKLFMRLILDAEAMGEFCRQVLPPVNEVELQKAKSEIEADPILRNVKSITD